MKQLTVIFSATADWCRNSHLLPLRANCRHSMGLLGKLTLRHTGLWRFADMAIGLDNWDVRSRVERTVILILSSLNRPEFV